MRKSSAQVQTVESVESAQVEGGVGAIVDYDRLLQALLRARNAFGDEFELRRMENLPALTLWTNVLRLDVLVREVRQRAVMESKSAPPVLKRHVRRVGEDE
jgi:hypothetical protein